MTKDFAAMYCDLKGISMEEFEEVRQVMHDAEIERQIDELLILNEQYA